MTDRPTSKPNPDEAGRYEIRIGGNLPARWETWFEGLALSHAPDGTTVLRGLIVDQSALHGVLRQVRDLGLPLVSVARLEPTPPAADPAN